MATPGTAVLSDAQLATLAAPGEERTAQVGEHLFDVGDREYPFVAIREGEVAIRDAAGRDIARHGPSGFLGEMNLLTSVPGIYAAGDVRAGSTKRCATAVGEGAMVVSYVHSRLADVAA